MIINSTWYSVEYFSMTKITRVQLMLTGIVSAVVSFVPGTSHGTVTTETPQVDLRPQGKASEAAVKAIMEKWRLNVREARPKNGCSFCSFKPQFSQSKRPT
jgi:hypothetical protein